MLQNILFLSQALYLDRERHWMLEVAYLMLTFSSDILIRERDNATSFIAGIPHCRVQIHRIRPTDRRTLQSKHQTRRRSFQIGQIHFRRSLSLDAIAPPPFFLEALGVHIHPEHLRMTSRMC